MGKKDFEPGTSKLETFWYWINERHRIYLKKEAGVPWPWTDDEILREYKFTNAFRQLDAGTKRYTKIVECIQRQTKYFSEEEIARLIVFNTIAYRMTNRVDFWDGCICKVDPFIDDWHGMWKDLIRHYDGKVFTGAHMTVGLPGQPKVETLIGTLDDVWECLQRLTLGLVGQSTLEGAFKYLLDCEFTGIGKFIGYEIISDLRWSVLDHATDTLTWANIGPGCRRGLLRLGMEVSQASLQTLWKQGVESGLESHVRQFDWPFELREIEHSLCEFDKYERVRTGAGRPRGRYYYDS